MHSNFHNINLKYKIIMYLIPLPFFKKNHLKGFLKIKEKSLLKVINNFSVFLSKADLSRMLDTTGENEINELYFFCL